MLRSNLTPYTTFGDYKHLITPGFLEKLQEDPYYAVIKNHCVVGNYVVIIDGSYSVLRTNNMMFRGCGRDFMHNGMYILYKITAVNGDFPTASGVINSDRIAQPLNNLKLVDEHGTIVYSNNEFVCKLKEEQVPHHLRFTK